MMGASPFQPKLVHGSADLVEVLEDALERVRAGELVGVVIAGITSNGMSGWTGAFKEDAAFPWARLHAVTATAANDLLVGGCDW